MSLHKNCLSRCATALAAIRPCSRSSTASIATLARPSRLAWARAREDAVDARLPCEHQLYCECMWVFFHIFFLKKQWPIFFRICIAYICFFHRICWFDFCRQPENKNKNICRFQYFLCFREIVVFFTPRWQLKNLWIESQLHRASQHQSIYVWTFLNKFHTTKKEFIYIYKLRQTHRGAMLHDCQ